MTSFYYKFSPKGVIRVIGEDAEDYLQSQWSIDIKKLPIGGVRHGLRLSTKGKVLADSYFLRLDEEEFILVSKECEGEYILNLLHENIVADEVEFSNETQLWDFIALWQKNKNPNFQALSLEKPAKNQFSKSENGFFFEDSRSAPGTFSMLLPKQSPWQKLNKCSVQTSSEYERLRIEAGQASVPFEIGPQDLPQEGNLEKEGVDFNKGCYLGQEVMARIHAMGRVRRQTCPVFWPNHQHPPLPCPVFSGNKKVGELKSLFKINPDKAIGIAIIHEQGIETLEEDGLSLEQFTEHKIFKL